MGEVKGTKSAQTILDRGVFLRSRAEAPYFIGTVSTEPVSPRTV